MRVLVAVAKGAFVVAILLLLIDDLKARPVEIEADAGVISMVATVEAVDATRQVVTVVGPNVPLDQAEVGDEVVLEVTRALAVDIRPV